MKLLRFKNVGYGDYKCSICRDTVIVGEYVAVGEEYDDEGYGWRAICNCCLPKITLKNMTDEEIFSKYKPAELI